MADLLEVVLVVDRRQDVLLFLGIQSCKQECQHALQVVTQLSLRASFFQPRELRFSAHQILRHRLIGLPPDSSRVEVVQEELVHSDRCFLRNLLTQGGQEQLDSLRSWLALVSGGTKLLMRDLPHSFICRACELGSQMDGRRHLQGILAFTAVVQIHRSFFVLLEQLNLSPILGYTISIRVQLALARAGCHRGTWALSGENLT